LTTLKRGSLKRNERNRIKKTHTTRIMIAVMVQAMSASEDGFAKNEENGVPVLNDGFACRVSFESYSQSFIGKT